jgi:DNA-binding transcriptional ArsR family regulator
LRILYRLRQGECTVGEIARVTGYSQPNVSRHLAQLHRSGMLSRRQEGNSVFYAITDETVFEICDRLCGRIKEEFEAKVGELKEGL